MENLVYSLAIYFFHTGGDRSLHDPDPINRLKSIGYLQTLTIVRVWHRAQKSPAQRLGSSVWRVSRRLCDASKARGATGLGDLWAV